ncbi:MAG: TonB-dependent receptor [Acidobacteriota bacterium]|nr:TonB-dependent receptor [Acidobacteriota bacterium]
MLRNRLSICLMILFGLLLSPALVAMAQQDAAEEQAAEEPSNEEEAAEEEEAGAVTGQPISEEITVTARKREENIQDVPVAVTVLPAETLEDSGVEDISEIQSQVPNLSIYSGRNQSTTLTAFLRGIGQADPLWGVDPGVGLYLDDVYIARPQGALLDVFDIGQIEVLRGPQGTLYGKNTIGGAIKYTSRALTDDFRGKVAVTGGSYNTQDIKASVSGALVPGKLRAGIAFASLTHDGYGTNLFTGRDVSDKDTFAARLSLDWLVSDDVTVKFRADRTEDDAEPKGLTRLEANPFCPLFLGATCPPLDDIFDTQSGLEPLNSTETEGYSLTVDWAINEDWRFKSITAYRESDTENNIDFDTTPAPITDVEATYYDEQTSQEFQFIYDSGGRFDGVFGLYYFDGSAGGLVRNNFLNSLFGTTDGFTDTESFALFGDGTYALSDRLNLNFGVRLTEEEKRGVAFNAGYTDATFTVINAVTADYDQSETFTSVAPKLGLDYSFTDDVLGYVTLSRGFKSGGFNVRAQATAFPESAEPFDDEVLTVGEVGLKSVLADRSLVLNIAAFYGDYEDIQVSTFTSYDSDGDGTDDAFFGNFLNAGSATISGVEVEFNWISPTVSWFGLSGNVSYLDASPDEFLDENGDFFVDTQVISNAPEFTGALNLNFDFPAFGGLITSSIGYAYRDEAILTNEGGPDPTNPAVPLLPISQDSYGIVNAWISWLSGSGTWQFTINGKNLGDEEYLTNGYNIPVLGILQGSYGAPETVTATLGYRF